MPELKITPLSDIAKPGTTPPPATSKPVVTGTGSETGDPMVTPATATKSQEEPTPQAADNTEEVPAQNSTTVEVSTGSMKSRVTPSATAAEITKDAQNQSDKDMAEKKPEKSDQDIADERKAKVNELIESGEYVVEIGAGKGGKSIAAFMLTVGGILVAGALLVSALHYFGIIDIGLNLPKKNKEVAATTAESAPTPPSTVNLAIPKSSFKLQYKNGDWLNKITPPQGTVAYATSLVKPADANTHVDILIDEDVTKPGAECEANNTCPADATKSDFKATRIPGVKKQELYLVQYIKASTKDRYLVSAVVTKASTPQALANPSSKITYEKDGKKLQFSMNVFATSEGNSLLFNSLAEAQAYFSSERYKQQTELIMSLTDS